MPELRALTAPFSSDKAADDWYAKLKKYAWLQRRTTNTVTARALAGLGNWGLGVLPEYIVNERSRLICTAAVTHPHQMPDLYARDKMEACHILAHLLQPPLSAFHGPEFSKTFLDLVERVFDLDTKREAGKIMRKYKIKTRVVSEEARERAKTRVPGFQRAQNQQNVESAADRIRKMLQEVKKIGS